MASYKRRQDKFEIEFEMAMMHTRIFNCYVAYEGTTSKRFISTISFKLQLYNTWTRTKSPSLTPKSRNHPLLIIYNITSYDTLLH